MIRKGICDVTVLHVTILYVSVLHVTILNVHTLDVATLNVAPLNTILHILSIRHLFSPMRFIRTRVIRVMPLEMRSDRTAAVLTLEKYFKSLRFLVTSITHVRAFNTSFSFCPHVQPHDQRFNFGV